MPLRWLLWLLAFSVPVQASAGVWLRAGGPAHIHLDIPLAPVRAEPLGHGHSHGHAGSRIAPHEHAPAHAGILYLADGDEGDHGGSPHPLDKSSALDSPALLPGPPAARSGPAGAGAHTSALPAHGSVDAEPLYRPPR